MNAIIQFDLFEERPSEIDLLRADIVAIKNSSDKVRKGAYANINELKKRCLDLEMRLEILECHICNGNK